MPDFKFYSMENTFEYRGVWWLPDDPDNKVAGILKYNPKDGLKLELMGILKGSEPYPVNENDNEKVKKYVIGSPNFINPTIILGETFYPNQMEITLYRNIQTNFSFTFFGMPSSSFFSQLSFIGFHFKKEEDINFDSISINYSNIEIWANLPVFYIEKDYTTENKGDKIGFNFLNKKEFKLDNLNLSIENIIGQKLTISDINLNNTMFIKIEPKSVLHFNDYDSIFQNLLTFLSLGMNIPAYPLLIKAKSKKYKQKIDNETIYPDIFILYSRNYVYNAKKIDTPYKMFFLHTDIEKDFEKILNNWFNKSIQIESLYKLYFGTVYNSYMYPEHKFLNFVQALESYHRRTEFGKYVTDEDAKKLKDVLIKAIPQEIDKEFKDALKSGKLNYLNEFSLRKRLKEIFEKIEKVVKLHFIKDKEQFINDVVNTRNYLTHYDKKDETKAKDPMELNQDLQKIIRIIFLIELEVPVKTIKELTSRHGFNDEYDYISW